MVNSATDVGLQLAQKRKLVTVDGVLRSVEGAINHVNSKADLLSTTAIRTISGRGPGSNGAFTFQAGDVSSSVVTLPQGHTTTGYTANGNTVTAHLVGLGEAVAAVSSVGVSDNSLTNQKFVPVTGPLFKGRVSGSGNVEDITNMASVRTMLNVADGATRNVNAIETSSIGKVASLAEDSTPDVSYWVMLEDHTTGGLIKTKLSDLPGSAIPNDSITYAKIQNVTTARVLGRVTGGSGDIEELTAAQLRTLANVADGATANPNAISTTDTNGLTALAEKATPAAADLLLLQDVAGGNVYKKAQVGNLPITVPNASVALTKLSTQAANTVVANTTGSTASPTAVTLASFKTWLALVGTDMAVGYTPVNYSTGGQNVVQHLTGIDSAIAALVASGVTDNSVTFAKMQDIATATVIGRTAGGSGDPSAITLPNLATAMGALTATRTGAVIALPEVTTPDGADRLLGEKSSDGSLFNIQIGNLTTGGGSPGAAWTTKREMIDGIGVSVRPIDETSAFVSVRALGAIGNNFAVHTVQNAIDNNATYGVTWSNLANAQSQTGIADLAAGDYLDWVGIQRAINRGAAIGRRVRIENGKYLLNRSLTYTATQTPIYSGAGVEAYLPAQGPVIEGESAGGTFLRWTAVNSVWTGSPDDGRGYGIRFMGDNLSNNQIGVLGNLVMRNFTVWGPSHLPANNTVGILVGSYNHITFDHVQVYNWGTYGIQLLRQDYSVGSNDDRSMSAHLRQVRIQRIGKDFADSVNPGSGIAFHAGADTTWVASGTRGYEIDHVKTELCELMGGGWGGQVYAQEYVDVASLFSGNLGGLDMFTGNTNHVSQCCTLISTRFEQDGKIAGMRVGKLNTLTMMSCRFVGGYSSFADAEYPHAPAIWFSDATGKDCRAVITTPEIETNGRHDIFRIGRANTNTSNVHLQILNPQYFPAIDPVTQKEVNIIGPRVDATFVNNKSAIVVKDGVAFKWDDKGDGYQVLPRPISSVAAWPPTSGTYEEGEIVSNRALGGGKPSGGRCTIKGTVATADTNLRGYGLTGQDLIRMKGTVMPVLRVGQYWHVQSGNHLNVPRRIVRVPARHMDGPVGKVQTVAATNTLILAVGSNYSPTLNIETGDVFVLDGSDEVYGITNVVAGSGIVTLTVSPALPSAPPVGTPIYVSKLKVRSSGGSSTSAVEFNFNADVATGFQFKMPSDTLTTLGLTLPGEGGWRLSSYTTSTKTGNIHTALAAPIASFVGCARISTVFLDAASTSTMTSVVVDYSQPTFVTIPGQITGVTESSAITVAELQNDYNNFLTAAAAAGHNITFLP